MYLSVGSIVSMTQKENALLLFHLIGKIMYNKRSIVLLYFRCHNTQSLRRQRRSSSQVRLCERHLTRTCARPNTERSATPFPVVGPGGAKNESSRCQCLLSLYDDYTAISLKLRPMCSCFMRPHQSMRHSLGFISIKIIHNIAPVSRNAAR
jgi:hypothetical protein